MGFVESVKNFYVNYIKFDGEIEKMEYIWDWVYCLLTFCIAPINFIPRTAIVWRRLKTIGWNPWLVLVPFISIVLLFIEKK